MNLGIEGRVAVVGGASSGLGRATALALADAGCELLLWSRDAERLAPVAEELRARGGSRVEVAAADASQQDCAETIATTALDRFDHVDILILNAGGPPPCDPLATEPEAWRAAFQLLVVTPVGLATRLLPPMRERKWGRVVTIVSSGIREPIPHLAYSNSGRLALTAWLKTISRPLAADGVTVNSVAPGRIATPRIASLDGAMASRRGISVEQVQAESKALIPAGYYGDPAQFAATVAFLCSELAAYQTGTVVPVDGGMLHGV